MNVEAWQSEQFEHNRARLRSIAYRMLGSSAEADDAVQETWLRFARADTAAVENFAGWLTTVISRICLDMLRARRARNEELAELPSVTLAEAGDPEHEALIADAVGVALLVVLETLSPPERLAFVLHDMFGIGFDEIAPILGRSPAAARQLASRARRRVRGVDPETTSRGLVTERRVVDAFLAASREGDFQALVAVLDPDVVMHADRGPEGEQRVQYRGADAVAGVVLARGTPLAPLARAAIVDGQAGALVVRDGRLRSVVKFTVMGDRVARIDLTVDPRTLARVRL